MSANPSWSRGWGARLLALALGTALALGMVELLLRAGVLPQPHLLGKLLLVKPDDPSVDYHCYPDDPIGDMIPRPEVNAQDWVAYAFVWPPVEVPLASLERTPRCIEYRYADTGTEYRIRTADSRIPEVHPGQRRVLAVGDSFTFGEGVPFDATLLAQTERRLGSKAVFFNAGRSGADTAFERELADLLTPALQPDALLVVFLVNDIGLTEALQQRSQQLRYDIIVRPKGLDRELAASPLTRDLLTFRTLSTLWALRQARMETLQWYRDAYDPAQNADNLAALEGEMRGLADRKIPVALVLYPLLEGLEDGYPLADVHARVAAMAQRAGLPVLDLAPSFAGQRSSTLWANPIDHHPNREANRIASKALAPWLAGLPGFL